MKRFLLFYVSPLLLVLLFAVSSLIEGSRTLYYRDVLTSHFPLKTAHAQLMEEGAFLPLVDPYRSGGQPLMGNPNLVPYYPTNLLYRIASPLWALNAHFWIHWMLAPFGMFWLAREWGLKRPSAWAAGVVYGTSGYLLSLLNLYNLIGPAVWMPAFAAACLRARKLDRGLRPSMAVALTWGLFILSGDPMTTLLGFAVALSAWFVGSPGRSLPSRSAAGSLVGSLALGTLLAAPLWVEMLRILPLSYRGYWRYSVGTSLAQSWNPWTGLETLVPLIFGSVDHNFWGYSFFGGNPPLLYSLFPGVLAWVLVLASGRPVTRTAWWGWSWIGIGLFISAGFYNPIIHLIYQLPGASALRYPVKCFILVAVGASLLAALGFEKILDGERKVGRFLGFAALGYFLLWGALILLPGPVEGMIRGLDPETFKDPFFGHQRLQWATTIFFVLAGTLALWLTARQADRRSPYAVGAVLLAVHAALQCFLLQPLFDSEEASRFTPKPAVAEGLPTDARLAHGTFMKLFGDRDPGLSQKLGGPELFRMTRLDFNSFGHYAGVQHGFKYELNASPEGLDSFFSVALIRGFKDFDDLTRVRILAAAGAEHLLLARELSPEATEQAELVARVDADGFDTWHYRLKRVLPKIQVVGNAERADNLNVALGRISDPSFDPRETALLPDSGISMEGPPGTARILAETHERLEVETSSPSGGVLTTRRAWLPIYRATVDGEPVEPQIVNIYKMGVVVPPGEHRVVIETDRRPTWAAFTASVLAALTLLFSAAYGRAFPTLRGFPGSK